MKASTLGSSSTTSTVMGVDYYYPARMNMRLNREGVSGACGARDGRFDGRCIGRRCHAGRGTNRSREGEERSARKRHQRDNRRRPAIHRDVQPARDAAERRHRREALPDRQLRRAPRRVDGRRQPHPAAVCAEVERREGSDGVRSRADRRARRRTRRWPTAAAAMRWTTTTHSCRRRRIARSGC